ncbi:MAG TPA: hypothetical protein VNX46_09495 [Candidatus Acidoferrum sp.]|jgi:hypothetical protein|nr:hypothetical protein [Candidatus Acidoferrum sp.]
MNQIKLTAIAALFAVAAFQTKADTTNLVQDVSIQLNGFRQGAPRTNSTTITVGVDTTSVGTAGVIGALGAATGNSFSTGARLVSVTPLAGGDSAVQVRDGGNTVDVTAFFSHQQFGDTLFTSTTSRSTGRTSESDYSVQRFALHDADGFPALTLHFDVQGITEADDTAVNGVSSPGSNITASVVGSGDRNGRSMIFTGTISMRGHTTEVVPDGGPGDGGPGV